MPPADQTFTFTFEPEMKHLTLAFEGWAAEVKDWRRAWTDVRKLFRNHERQHLDSEGTTTGERFATLQGKTYPGWKSRHYPGLPILQRDKVLYNALVEGGPGSLFKRNRKSMEIGIRKGTRLHTYAEAHQKGRGNAYAGANKEPRPPVRFGRDASNKSEFAYALGQIMQAHIVLARRRVFKPEIERSFGKKHAESEAGARATIKKMVNGTWR
jgi:hypothetical protein